MVAKARAKRCVGVWSEAIKVDLNGCMRVFPQRLCDVYVKEVSWELLLSQAADIKAAIACVCCSREGKGVHCHTHGAGA